jgi:hypothetical protein
MITQKPYQHLPIEYENDWVRRDEEAWEAAAVKLCEEGYIRVPYPSLDAIFCREDGAAILVRALGTLDWHPVPYEETHG